jgi:hypothetical protein
MVASPVPGESDASCEPPPQPLARPFLRGQGERERQFARLEPDASLEGDAV